MYTCITNTLHAHGVCLINTYTCNHPRTCPGATTGDPHGLHPDPYDVMFKKQIASRRNCRIAGVKSIPSH